MAELCPNCETPVLSPPEGTRRWAGGPEDPQDFVFCPLCEWKGLTGDTVTGERWVLESDGWYLSPGGATKELAEVRVFDSEAEAERAIPRDQLNDWEIVELDLRLRLKLIIGAYDGSSDDNTDNDLLLAKTNDDIETEPYLLVERSGDGDRVWLSLHPTVVAAAENVDAGDWSLQNIIDVRDSSEWDVVTTYRAVPRDAHRATEASPTREAQEATP